MNPSAWDFFWVGVALLVAALGAVFVLRRRPRRVAPPPADDGTRLLLRGRSEETPPGAVFGAPAIVLRAPRKTRHPVVLAHGYFGFDAIGPKGIRREYFRGVRDRLVSLGYDVYVVRMSPAAGVAHRAEQLAEQVKRIAAERVNIIAHSMGGIDARYAIARLGLDERVASLTTIGTPHRGTPIADQSAQVLGERVRRILGAVGANVDGLYDLTTHRMTAFNEAVMDSPDVVYSSIVGAVSPAHVEQNAFLVPGHAYLLRKVGPNDGMVPAESQKWGSVLAEVDADHWAQIGWSRGFDARSFDARSFYVMLAEHLAKRGL
jgi:triacylglycerol lipase